MTYEDAMLEYIDRDDVEMARMRTSVHRVEFGLEDMRDQLFELKHQAKRIEDLLERLAEKEAL